MIHLHRRLLRGRVHYSTRNRVKDDVFCDCTRFPPASLNPGIDTTSALPRISDHNHHIFLSHGLASSWPSTVAFGQGSVAAQLEKQIIVAKQKKDRILFNLCEIAPPVSSSSRSAGTTEALVFPSGRHHILPSEGEVALESLLRDDKGTPLTGVQIMLCGHAARDARCGMACATLKPAIEAWLAKHDIAGQVRPVSHLGGHKFAGVAVIYLPDDWSCVWYSRLNSDNLHDILYSTIVQRKLVMEHVRYSSGSFSHEWSLDCAR